jgi:hypothetical protein
LVATIAKVKPLEIVVMDSRGARRTLRFSSKPAAVAFLKKTHATKAVVSFTYADGSPLKQQTMDRIFQQVFQDLERIAA